MRKRLIGTILGVLIGTPPPGRFATRRWHREYEGVTYGPSFV